MCHCVKETKWKVIFFIFLERNSFSETELYSGKYGYHALFPYDTLHTLCKGAVEKLKDGLIAYADMYKTTTGNCVYFSIAILCFISY